MSIEILDCLKRERDICVKTIITRQNTAFTWTPALKKDKVTHKKLNPVTEEKYFFSVIINLSVWNKLFVIDVK